MSLPAAARLFIALGATAALLAVALGAFGAHGLKARLTPDLLAVYQTAVQYHFWHAIGLVLIGLLALHMPDSGQLRAAGWLMLAGILLFSGSLYALALSGERWLGAVTPFGGLAFLLAWASLVWAVLRA